MAGDGKVIAVVNSDQFIERFKGRKPVQSTVERMKMLRACKYVDIVIANGGEEDSKKNVDWLEEHYDLTTDIVAIGSDWAGRDYYGQMNFTKEWLDEKNIVLVYVDRRTGQSTTKLKQALKDY